MEAYIYDAAGTARRLPVLLRWEVSHGFCSPCDAFEADFLYDRELLTPLKAACRIRARHDGRTVFFGVADEFELTADSGGCICTLRGRGMQALLLDSEAESADYYNANTAFILNRHVRPLGVTDIDEGGAGKRTASLMVSSGESHWSVVKRFAEFCLALHPRFTPAGRLLLDGAHSGNSFTVSRGAPPAGMTYGQDRYGVISEALVQNRMKKTSVRVENEAFQAIGGKCVRVISVPRKTGFDAMRHTGTYRIRQSEANFTRCRLTLPGCFAAFPGDTAILEETPLGITGEFTVSASRSYADGRSAGTVLELKQTL